MTIAKIAPGDTTVGWIGTGLMGGPMAGHLLDAGYRIAVHTRTRPKAESLVARGAQWADHPRALTDACDVVVSMVGLPSEVGSHPSWAPEGRSFGLAPASSSST